MMGADSLVDSVTKDSLAGAELLVEDTATRSARVRIDASRPLNPSAGSETKMMKHAAPSALSSTADLINQILALAMILWDLWHLHLSSELSVQRSTFKFQITELHSHFYFPRFASSIVLHSHW
jgi:hypothetical protein